MKTRRQPRTSNLLAGLMARVRVCQPKDEFSIGADDCRDPSLSIRVIRAADIGISSDEDEGSDEDEDGIWSIEDALNEDDAEAIMRFVDEVNPDDWFWYAVEFESINGMRILHDFGADVDLRKFGETPIERACKYMSVEVLHLLAHWGADFLERQNEDGYTGFMHLLDTNDDQREIYQLSEFQDVARDVGKILIELQGERILPELKRQATAMGFPFLAESFEFDALSNKHITEPSREHRSL